MHVMVFGQMKNLLETCPPCSKMFICTIKIFTIVNKIITELIYTFLSLINKIGDTSLKSYQLTAISVLVSFFTLD